MNEKNITELNNPLKGSRACDVREIVDSSQQAFREYARFSLSRRKELISTIQQKLIPLVPRIAEMEYQETKMGNTSDKIVKLMLATGRTPG